MPRFSGTRVSPEELEALGLAQPAKKPRFSGTLVDGGSAPAPAADNLSWSDVASQAASNAPASALQVGKDMAQPFLHPIVTATSLRDIGAGVLSKMGVMDADESAANAVGWMLADRYNGIENIKRTIANDPVGFLSDAATVLSGGGLLGAKAGGMAGRIASVASKAGDIIDPAATAGRAVAGVARPVGTVAANALGMTTGVGGDAVREMRRAGADGNLEALGHLRGGVSGQRIVDDAHAAMGEIRNDRGASYLDSMSSVFSDTTPLPLTDVDNAMAAAWREVHPTGKLPSDAEAASALKDIRSVVHQARRLDDTTPRGLDNLKRRVDAIGQNASNPFAKRIANKISDSLIDTIAAKHPEYRTGLADYTQRSAKLTELGKEFSLFNQNPNASLRKLLSSLRQNANTGKRGELLRDALAAKQPSLPGMIAGHEMASLTPRGGVRWGWGAGGVLGPAMGLSFDPLSLALAAAAASPRVVGEAAYKLGQAQRLAHVLTPAQRRLISHTSYQTGRASDRQQGRR